MGSRIDESYDGNLKGIEKLTWLPWVGKKYFNSKVKVLIVGESHYADAKDEAQRIIDIGNSLNNTEFTRQCIEQAAVEESWEKNGKKVNPPTYTNISRLLVGKSHCSIEERENLWGKVGYYNFIQSIMDTKTNRPLEVSFYDSWSTFIKVIQILKPTHCLFIGVSASDTFNQVMKAMNIKYQGIQRIEKKISNTFGRKGAVLEDNLYTDIVFIKHTGKFFSWSKWNNFLQNTIPEMMNFLKSIITGE